MQQFIGNLKWKNGQRLLVTPWGGGHPTKVERQKTCTSISFFRGTFLPLKELLWVLPSKPMVLEMSQNQNQNDKQNQQGGQQGGGGQQKPDQQISSQARSRVRADSKAVNRAGSKIDNQSDPSRSAPSANAGGFLSQSID